MSKLTVLFLSFLMIHAACAAELFGSVEAVSGEATVTGVAGARTRIIPGLKVFSGQSIQTAADGEVHIVTEDSGLIALRPNSSFRIDRYQAKGKSSDETVFSLFKGALYSITGWIAKRNAAAYRLNTPNATIGVRGTEHETTIIETAADDDQPGTFDMVFEGATVMRTPHGEVEVHPGEHAFAAHGQNVAPRLLAQRPGFLKRRALKIEDRIQQRKDSLRQYVQHHLEEAGEAHEHHGELKQGELKQEIKNRRDAIKQRVEQHGPRKRHNPQ